MKRTRVALVLSLPIAAALALAFAACDGTGAYVYYARQYDEPRDCLGPVEALDVLSGTDPGFGCAARCIVVKDTDGAVYIYGTSQCGPTPLGANAQEGDPRCPAVRAAVNSSNVCKPDSGIKEAGVDAPVDGAAEAAVEDAAAEASDAGTD